MSLAENIKSAPLNKTHLFFTGQAGFIVKSKKGTLLGVDLYLSECVERAEGHMGFKRLTPKVLAPDELEFDFCIATHPHYDHFDMDAIPVIMYNHRTKLFASINCEREVERLLMKTPDLDGRISYFKPHDFVTADDIKIDFVPCDHGAGAPDAFGVVLDVDGYKIYLAGDTCFRKDYAEEISNFGPFDIMFAPINGAFGNLNEQECVDLAKIIKPRLLIPCHYGTFAAHGGNPWEFVKNCKRDLPGQKYDLLCIGEHLVLDDLNKYGEE